ncbi:Fic family protein [Synergistaceae bacterium OttesenSCG-928-I11]|nr:Fic family protein [Synergistaceae bacterium OttesenSCG-928-I11]
MKPTRRQQQILDILRKNPHISAKEIAAKIEDVSKVTILRDLNTMLDEKRIVKQGAARSVTYAVAYAGSILEYFDETAYFANDVDRRQIKHATFHFELIQQMRDLFTASELTEIEQWNGQYRDKISKLPPALLQKELERLTIELSWKSSRIEGNTYTLLDTEMLIREHVEAKGHKKEEATMILNHKKALDYVFRYKADYKQLTIPKIEDLHTLLVEGLGVGTGLRSHPVGIVGTDYRPLDNRHQIRDALEGLVQTINATEHPFARALIAVLMISYIQPFEDGNKRTSRILANALLLQGDYCPISYRSVDEVEYKKAVVLFYEQNSAEYFKRLFIEQFRQAVQGYF